jgi:hypothetical protein
VLVRRSLFMIHERVAYISLALLYGRIAVRIGATGVLTEARHDGAMDEAQNRDGAQGDGNDEAAEELASSLGAGHWLLGYEGLMHTRSYQGQSR